MNVHKTPLTLEDDNQMVNINSNVMQKLSKQVLD